jgi:radical SAM protein with 4Fe4S-binding SPASM domain
MQLFIDAGARDWQVQLTVAMGRAADHPEILLQPYQLLEVMPLLAELYEEGLAQGLHMQPGNNIGYFGPHETLFRGNGDERVHWSSCNAGQNTLGIEADGTIKGCPSLPTTDYAGGNIRDLTLEDMWRAAPEISFTRERTSNDLWGFCQSCYYADVCRSGCTWTTHVLFGRAGNNPYCHHRALELEQQGLRESVIRSAPAPGQPFDYGRFDLVLETLDGTPVSPTANASTGQTRLVQIKPARARVAAKQTTQKPTTHQELVICRGCNRHVMPGTRVCPHCGVGIATMERKHKKRLREARQAYDALVRLLPGA